MSDLKEKIRNVVEGEPVVVFMKGTPQWIACGNSGRALEALRSVGASAATVDILPDAQIRQELTALYGWPTVPQVFVNGELIGGADIVEELASSGQLASEIDKRLGDGGRNGGEERVVELAEGSGNAFRVVS
ncbi:MAG: glutaredoxin family protein [Gaiellaceae bacterium]